MKRKGEKLGPQYLLLALILLGTQLAVISVEKSFKREAPKTNLLVSEVPLVFSKWYGTERELDSLSLDMLQPEAYLVRDYRSSDGWAINLTIIYGHEKSSIHSPALCLLGGGWNIISKSKRNFSASGWDMKDLELARLVLQKEERKVLVLYSFLSPGNNTAGWTKFQARLLGQRLTGKQPSGALLRLIIPLRGNEEAAEITAEEFLEEIYPEILSVFSL